MEVWYHPETLEVKAIYSGNYTGQTWQSRGLTRYERPGPLNSLIVPGAIIEFVDGDLDVRVPFVPEPVVRVNRWDEYQALPTEQAKQEYIARHLFMDIRG